VLHELQLVADSSDPMKRNRGRRGLDILQRMQKMTNITVQIVEEDFPQVRESRSEIDRAGAALRRKIVHQRFQF